MGGSIAGIAGSAIEGIDALGKTAKNVVEGDWEEAGKNFARYEMEAVGIVGQFFLGEGAEIGQETLEGALDNAVLERQTGDVPGPDEGSADWSADNLLKGAAGGALESSAGLLGGGTGAMESALGSESIGKILGVFAGSEGSGSTRALQEMLASGAGLSGGGSGGQLESFVQLFSKFSEGVSFMGESNQRAGKVNDRIVSSSV